MPIPRRQVVLAAAVFMAAGRDAGAQLNAQPEDGGPVIIGERTEGWRAVELKNLGAALDFNARYRSDSVKQQGQEEITDRETRIRETVDLNAQIYFGHKNLVDFTGTAQLGLEQRFIKSDSAGIDADENQTTDLYNLSALVLGNSFVPTTVYTRRDEVLIDQAFAGSVDSLTTETGIISNIRSVVAPTTIRAFHLENDQTSQFGQNDSSLDQNTIAAESNITISDRHRLQLTYTFDQISETQGSTFENDYDRNDALLADTLTFGGTKQHMLHSYLRFYDESGKFAYQTIRWDEQLLLNHSQTLETRYNTTVERQTRADSEQTVARGDANIRHELFESLVSTGTVGGQYLTTSENFDSTDLFMNGNLEYTKLVPKGRVDASAGAGINFQQNSDRGGTLSVINEPHTFNDPFPIVLSRRQIVEGSIVMTGVGGFPTYQEGVDYTVQYFPDRAEVTINPGRGINTGQTLWFDYDVGPEPGSNIDTLTTAFTFRYTFTETFARGLSLYTTYRTQDSNIDTEDPSQFVLDDTQVLQYGAEYRRGGLTLRAEQENRESNVNPYDTTRLQATYDYLLGPGSVVTADATYDLIQYENPENQVEFMQFSARWEQRLTETLSMNLRLEYRDEQDDLSGDSQGFEQHFGMRFRYRQTHIFAELHNAFLNSDTSDQTSQTFEFGLRRDF